MGREFASKEPKETGACSARAFSAAKALQLHRFFLFFFQTILYLKIQLVTLVFCSFLLFQIWGESTFLGGQDVYSTKYGARLNTKYEIHISIGTGWQICQQAADDSRISPEMLVHSRPLQFYIISYYLKWKVRVAQTTLTHAYQTCIKRIVRFANSLQVFFQLLIVRIKSTLSNL